MAARSARSCSILPCHPPHAVTCLDGFPMTKQGRGGVALGLTVFASFVGASWGITEMIFLSPLLVKSGAAIRSSRGVFADAAWPVGGLDTGARLADQRRVDDRAGPVPRLDRHRPRNRIGTLHVRHDRTRRRHRADRACARPVRHRRVHEQHQSGRADHRQIHQCPPQGHAADHGRVQAFDLPDVPRHHRRQPVLAHSRHRADDRFVRRLCDGKENIEDAGKIRHRHDRRRGLPGSGDALFGAGRFHSRP